jgi:hypothetical protein
LCSPRALLVCVVIVLMGFVGVCHRVFLSFVGVHDQCYPWFCWCLWLCFWCSCLCYHGLLVFVVMLVWALLVVLVVALMGSIGVLNHYSRGFYWCS